MSLVHSSWKIVTQVSNNPLHFDLKVHRFSRIGDWVLLYCYSDGFIVLLVFLIFANIFEMFEWSIMSIDKEPVLVELIFLDNGEIKFNI